ncbi:hypothetical protein [Burkholderia pseudomallei]|uniref:hypothetical protein n=1 Tax=Burkholderia pseudomallei TaxID=28450 RepID=UPI0021F77521|nr:hypothetical protein [Burkholderia pseudomallei]MCV9992563.1 hypothetical protein [Burkholderia pseudomallei]
MTRLRWGRRVGFGAALAAVVTLFGACNGNDIGDSNRQPDFVAGSVRQIREAFEPDCHSLRLVMGGLSGSHNSTRIPMPNH